VFRFSTSPRIMNQILDRAREGSFTYQAVGATAGAELPDGFRHDHHERRLPGAGSFERAKHGLKRWAAHEGAGARVFPGEGVENGETVLVDLGSGPLHVVAPCRIVYVIDEPDRFGFAYGTLPGHPECGEESFLVERRRDDSSVFRIRAFSRPAHPLVRLGAPVARRVQVRITRRYLAALADYVSKDHSGP
jgi:uncharacterized protein (UPF0548 family)